jgi:hypothetical protein
MLSTQSPPKQWMLRVTPETPSDIINAIEASDLPVTEPRRFRCINCKTPVAFEVDIIQIGDIPSDTAQVNPHGFIHEVITVRSVQNTLVEGPPIPADSWFPGFCWRYLICSQCMEFLGWSYHRPNEFSMSFAGFSKQTVISPV